MTRTALAVMGVGVALLVAGVALIHIPSALIAAGILVVGIGVALVEIPDGEQDQPSRGDQ